MRKVRKGTWNFGSQIARSAAWHKGNDYSSVAYWYQTGRNAHHKELPPVEEWLPRRWPEHGLWDE